MSVEVKRLGDQDVEIRDGLTAIRVSGAELERVADELALYAYMCRCGDSMCVGCELSESGDPS